MSDRAKRTAGSAPARLSSEQPAPAVDPPGTVAANTPARRWSGAEKAAALQGVFPGVDPDVIARLLKRTRLRRFADGDYLCTQGQYEEAFYVLLDGQANVWVYEMGEGVLVSYIPAGEPVGELELLMDTPRDADVVAAGPVTALELHYSDLDLDTCPELYRALAHKVIERLLTTQRQRILDLAGTLRHRDRLDQLIVSYAHHDELFAKRLTTNLKHHRISVWLDQYDIVPGISWNRQIGEALDRCRLMLVIMSPASMGSGNSEDEWNYYLDEGKPIIPILYQPCRIPYRLNKLQYVDFVNVPYERALARLVATINGHYAEMATHSGSGDTPVV